MSAQLLHLRLNSRKTQYFLVYLPKTYLQYWQRRTGVYFIKVDAGGCYPSSHGIAMGDFLLPHMLNFSVFCLLESIIFLLNFKIAKVQIQENIHYTCTYIYLYNLKGRINYWKSSVEKKYMGERLYFETTSSCKFYRPKYGPNKHIHLEGTLFDMYEFASINFSTKVCFQ